MIGGDGGTCGLNRNTCHTLDAGDAKRTAIRHPAPNRSGNKFGISKRPQQEGLVRLRALLSSGILLRTPGGRQHHLPCRLLVDLPVGHSNLL